MNVSTDLSKAPVYVVLDGDILIDAPLGKVWTHVMDPPSWQNYSVYQHVSGEPGKEGELMLLKKEERGSSSTPYYARTVKIEPQQRVIWKIFREPGAEDGGPRFGIVDFQVSRVEGKTRFSYDVLYEIAPPAESERQAFSDQMHQNFRTLLDTVVPKLKVLSEGKSAAS